MGSPRGCDEVDDATDEGRPTDDGAKPPSRVGGDAVEVKLARWERFAAATLARLMGLVGDE